MQVKTFQEFIKLNEDDSRNLSDAEINYFVTWIDGNSDIIGADEIEAKYNEYYTKKGKGVKSNIKLSAENKEAIKRELENRGALAEKKKIKSKDDDDFQEDILDTEEKSLNEE